MATSAPAAVVLVRLLVGPVFISEGAQKFIFPAEVGAGRFAKIGIPSPELTAPFVGVVEVVCGALILLGLLTRMAAVPLVIGAMLLGSIALLLVGAGAWAEDAAFFKRQPGFISTQLHRGIGGSCVFVNYAVWESVAHFRQALGRPEFQEALKSYPPSAVGSPHLFEKVAVPDICVA